MVYKRILISQYIVVLYITRMAQAVFHSRQVTAKM